jgi:hypothetical protein
MEMIQTVIDISCGQGSLLKAARERYPNAKLLGVDIRDHDFYKTLCDCVFYHGDGIAYARQCKRRFDLILSNPPFGQTDKRNYESGLIQELDRKRLECQMLNANLSLMHEESWLIVILPSTFVTGSSYRSIRKAIANRFQVHSIILLPEDTFGKRRIRTYAVILSGHFNAKPTELYRVLHSQAWSLQAEASLSCDDVKSGNWWKNRTTGPGIEAVIFRGSVSSADFRKTGIPVYHSASIKDLPWHPSVRYVDKVKNPERNAAIGDIIISRVGHSTGYWWVNTENEYAITDCLFVLRGLESPVTLLERISVNGKLDIPLRGVATQYITQNDVLTKLADVLENHPGIETTEQRE